MISYYASDRARAWHTCALNCTWQTPCGGARLYIGSISASPTACPSHGYGRAGTQNDRLSEAVVSSTYPRDGNAVGDAEIDPKIDPHRPLPHLRFELHVADVLRRRSTRAVLTGAPASARARPTSVNGRLYIGSSSASPTACPSRGYGRAGTPRDGHAVGDADM